MSVKSRRYLLGDIALMALMGLVLAAYMLLGIDYMGEFRFATNFFPMLYLFIAVTLWRRISRITKQITLSVMLVIMGIAVYAEHKPRFQYFYNRPMVSFTRVANNFGFRFNKIAEYLELDNPSFLVPDIGGTLYNTLF